MAITPSVEMEFSGRGSGWTAVTGDVSRSTGIRGSRGINGFGPTDRVARTGLLHLALINSPANSGSKEGYYSPDHANVRAGFGVGMGIRVRVTIGSTAVTLYTGHVTRIEPTSGKFCAPRLTHITAVDYMDRLARHRLQGLALATNRTEAQVFDLIIADMPVEPRAEQVDTGLDTYPFVFDNMADETLVPMTEIQRLCQSSLGMCYVKGDGTLVYEERQTRADETASVLVALTDADLLASQPPRVDDMLGEQLNHILTESFPRRVDAAGANKVLYSLGTDQAFAPNETVVVKGTFRDPDEKAVRVSGQNMVTPAAGTDYIFHDATAGAGRVMTSEVTVAHTYSSNSIQFTITNNAHDTVYATTLQCRGEGVYSFESVVLEATNSDLVTIFGESAMTIGMPYQDDIPLAAEAAAYFLHLHSQESRRSRSIPLWLDHGDETRALLLAQRDISDRISLTETQTGLAAGTFHINSVDFVIDRNGHVWLYWIPVIADTTAFWRLGVAGKSELGDTTVFGFGLIVGHADSPHQDTHSDSAHGDVAHVDAHTDTAHSDEGHGDASHTDTFTDTAHGDAHTDTAHADVSHVDTPHTDSHSDIAHADLHRDAHGDASPHFDSHADGAHTDSHGDVSHSDTAHTDDAHADVAHTDTAHVDQHTDAGHSDTAHGDVAHVDSHTDTHTDAAHADSHSDEAHGDAG
jgi:hypothetical protein